MVQLRPKIFWFTKDDSVGHSEKKKEEEVDKRNDWKTILKIASTTRTEVKRDCCEVICGAQTSLANLWDRADSLEQHHYSQLFF